MATRRTPDIMMAKTITVTATGVTNTLSPLDSGIVFVSNTTTTTIMLPPVDNCPAGTYFKIVKITTGTNAITIDGNASETINGAATLTTVDAPYEKTELISNGSAWFAG